MKFAFHVLFGFPGKVIQWLSRCAIVLWICTQYTWAGAQPMSDPDQKWIDSIFKVIKEDPNLNSRFKSDLADSVFQISVRRHDICSQVYARILQANQLDLLGSTDSALVQLYWANKHFIPACDSMVLMAMYVNLTNVYLSLGELDRIDSAGNIALSNWNSRWKEKEFRFAILNNIAIAQASKGNLDASLALIRQAYHESLEAKNENYIQKGLINLGTIKVMSSELDSAYYFYNKASLNAKENADMDNYLTLMVNLANVERDQGRFKQSIERLKTAFAIADSLKNIGKKADIQMARALLYANMKNFQQAYDFLTEYIDLNNQYLNEERVKAVTEMMEKYESEKKAHQIQQLKVDNLDAALKNERITKTRNHFIYIGSGILLIALGLWGRLNYMHKSRAAIRHEKEISEGLLLNILPASVAEELKIKGSAEAKNFPAATILFSDFKSFTTISESLNAEDLVAELNVCFKEFDDIMTRHGLEKIKTIGDAYMAAAAVPANNLATADEVILAGIEMQQFIESRKADRDQQNLAAFEMRVGIHSGPVVAGIVGVKKFQYDIWGDTVNIASRMETNGEVGQVNISEATYQLVKDNPSLKFTSRGLIEAKGKGEMLMYFVELAA